MSKQVGSAHARARTVLVALVLAAGTLAVLAPPASADHGCGEDGFVRVMGTCVYSCGRVGTYGDFALVSYCLVNNARCVNLFRNVGLPTSVVVLGVPVYEACLRSTPVTCDPDAALLRVDVCNQP